MALFKVSYDDGLLLLSEPLLAQEYDRRLEYEAHCVQLKPLLDLAQEIGDVQPLHTTVVQKIARTQVNRLKSGNKENVI